MDNDRKAYWERLAKAQRKRRYANPSSRFRPHDGFNPHSYKGGKGDWRKEVEKNA